MSSIPGTIVTHSPASTEAYIGSPAIVIMPDGSYVASHDFFGPGTDFDEYAVYRSNDRGETWSRIHRPMVVVAIPPSRRSLHHGRHA